MISKTLGAPLGGTTVGGQYGLESLASILIVPPNGAGGFGRYLPSIVVVALGEPGVPVTCWAQVEPAVRARTEADNANARMVEVEFMVRLPRNDYFEVGTANSRATIQIRMPALSSTTITTSAAPSYPCPARSCPKGLGLALIWIKGILAAVKTR